jgi:hypothetical protein
VTFVADPWRVEAIQFYKNGRRMGDGDTLNVLTSKIMRLGHRNYDVREVDWLGIRLVWVDTPEMADENGPLAARQLTDWLGRAAGLGPLRVDLYESGGWDRVLGDLIDARGEHASEWLMRPIELGGCGWPAYLED